jgi:hypothetical protein
MDTILIQHKMVGPEGAVIVKAHQQTIKRGKHGRFTHYVPLKKAIDDGITALIGLAVIVLVGFIGYYFGIQSCINSAVISPLP